MSASITRTANAEHARTSFQAESPPPGLAEPRAVSAPVVLGVVRVLDGALLLLAAWLATVLLTGLYGVQPEGRLLLAAIVGTLTTCVCLHRSGAYEMQILRSLATQAQVAVAPLVAGAGSLIACLFLTYEGVLPFRAWPLAWGLIGFVLLGAERAVLLRLLRRWDAAGRLARRVAVVGVSEFSREFIGRLRAEPHAYTIVGLYDDRASRVPEVHAGVEVLGTVDDLLRASREKRVDVIVVALPLSAAERIAAVLDQLGSAVADICLTTDLAGLRYRHRQFAEMGANPVISVREHPMKDWRAVQKRAFDLAVGSLLLLVLAPVLALVALLVKLDSRGPVLFRQPRLGFNNRLFTCYKFRSMRHDAADLLADRQTTRDDPRVTRLGRVLRRMSLDELPQLLNVLEGSMSLVGPRPHAPNTKAADRLFGDVVATYALRHRVLPGITGWAQVNGWRGETQTVEQLEKRVACDLYYIENWSLGLDLKILFLTLWREVFRSRAAY